MNSDSSDFVFTTEGHMLPIMHADAQIPSPSRPMYQSNHTLAERDPRLMARGDLEFRIQLQCPAYHKPQIFADIGQASRRGGLTGSVRDRPDFEYARLLAGISSGSERAIGMGFPAAKAVGHELEFTGPTPTSGSPLKKELSVVTDADKFWWRPDGWCDAMQAEEYVSFATSNYSQRHHTRSWLTLFCVVFFTGPRVDYLSRWSLRCRR